MIGNRNCKSWFFFFILEPNAHGWANRIPVTPSSVCQHFQTSSPLKPLGQLNSNFIWRLLRMGEQKFVQMVLVTWPRLPPHPYMVITLQKSSSPEPEGWWPWDLVCSIGGVGPTKLRPCFIYKYQMSSWPLTFYPSPLIWTATYLTKHLFLRNHWAVWWSIH